MTTAAAEFSTTGFYRAVYFDGPQPEQNHDGDEIPVWLVYVGDEDADPVGTTLPPPRNWRIAWRMTAALICNTTQPPPDL
jgi:hypothetical protein